MKIVMLNHNVEKGGNEPENPSTKGCWLLGGVISLNCRGPFFCRTIGAHVLEKARRCWTHSLT